MKKSKRLYHADKEHHLPKPLAHFLADKIRWNIIIGLYEPGFILREQHLEKDFGTSRGPIRESLRILLSTGLVEHEPRKGFRVRVFSRKEIEDNYRLRSILEKYTIQEIREKNPEPLLLLLDESVGRMQTHFRKNRPDHYFEESIHFHEIILDYTENEALASVRKSLTEVLLPIQYKSLSIDFESGLSLHQCKRIITSLGEGNFAEFEKLINSINPATRQTFAPE